MGTCRPNSVSVARVNCTILIRVGSLFPSRARRPPIVKAAALVVDVLGMMAVSSFWGFDPWRKFGRRCM